MNCKNCGRQNPSGSLYCQDCGHRLGDWVPPERPQKMATPPTGIARQKEPAPLSSLDCSRCGGKNAPHMRFCNHCGSPLSRPAVAEPAVPGPATSAPVCWRCRSAGDAGAEFCKFCGARYADDPANARSRSQPHAGLAAQGPTMSSELAPRDARDMAPRDMAPRPLGEAPARAFLVAILKDGSDGRSYPLREEQTDVGRAEGSLVLGEDPYLSPRHARVVLRPDGQLLLRDLDSVNGIYVRLREPVELSHGDMILLGQQVMRFEVLADTELPLGPATHAGVLVFGTPEVPRIARLVQYTTEGVGRDVHYLYRDETVIGREQGDIVCTDDPFMSRRHAAVSIDRATRRFVLRDLGSSNGTAIRIRGERVLRPGDQFRIGRHLFRYDRGQNEEVAAGRVGA